MRKQVMKKVLVFLVVLAAVSRARGEWKSLLGEKAPPLEISSWIAGPEGETLEDLRGRVVLLLLGDPEGTARWNDLRAAYRKKGLRVVSLLPAAPDEPPEGIEYCLAVGGCAAYGDGTGPRAVLLGADGKVGWEGEPGRLTDDVIAKHLKKAKSFHLRSVEAEAKSMAAAFRKGQLAKARDLAGERSGDIEYVSARIDAQLAYWRRQVERSLAAGDPAEALDCLKRIERHFAGTEEAAAAVDRLKELKADRSVLKEATAADNYVRLREELLRAKGRQKKIDALVKKAERFVERFAGTKGAERAARLVEAIKTDPAIADIQAFIAKEKIATASSRWRSGLPKPPCVAFDSGRKYLWHLQTNQGPMTLRFLTGVAPMHVSSTIYLTELGYYDGLTFHRVIPGFMAQGGCPDGNGRGSPGYQYAGEFGPGAKHDGPGVLSMANAGPGTDGSQFFITFAPAGNLDGKHTVFGELVTGMDTLRKIEKLGSESGSTKQKIVIEKATVSVE